MPRRKKPFLGTGVVLVDGGRYDLPDGAETPITILQGVKGNAKTIRQQVNGHVQTFDELAQLPDRECFIDDLVTECLSAQRMRLDYLVKGRRTKPDEWTAQILVRGLATVMEKHGLAVSLSEYEKQGKRVQSLFLRLIPGLIKQLFPVPRDVRGGNRPASQQVLDVSENRSKFRNGRPDQTPLPSMCHCTRHLHVHVATGEAQRQVGQARQL